MVCSSIWLLDMIREGEDSIVLFSFRCSFVRISFSGLAPRPLTRFCKWPRSQLVLALCYKLS